MLAVAKLKGVRISPQKARLVADQIRGKTIANALDTLSFGINKSSEIFLKLVNSAVANAENNFGADIDELVVSSVQVDAGAVLKRMHARAKGRGSRILKKTSHITVVLSDSAK